MQFVNHFIHNCFTYYKTTNKSTEHRFNCCFSSQSNHGVFFNKISRVSEITVIRNVNNEQILDKIHFDLFTWFIFYWSTPNITCLIISRNKTVYFIFSLTKIVLY